MPARPLISVIMPIFNRAAFIERAVDSLKAQRLNAWELIIVDDGSQDETVALAQRLAGGDQRIRFYAFEYNRGMGAALNRGLDKARARWIAYLPSDDLYYPEHLLGLATLTQAGTEDIVLAYSGLRYDHDRSSRGVPEQEGLQLVQVLHRKTADRWMERSELVTDDLERMMWGKLRLRGKFAQTNQVSCEWVSHPEQRHRILREPDGGINTYRAHYGVSRPLRFHSRLGDPIDEVEQYRHFRDRSDSSRNGHSMKILLVGELAHNADRVLALEERGHRLYGLWLDRPSWYNTVGPLPFGHVEDIPREDWKQAIARLQPDIIYAQLNWQAVPFAWRILKENPGIPFVWHFKEGPFVCLQKGLWPQLVDLYRASDGCIYSSAETRAWFQAVVPSLNDRDRELILDGELPKREWFKSQRSGKLSESDNQVHTVVPGPPIGIDPENVQELARAGIHLHFYGDFAHWRWSDWIEKTRQLAPNHLHLHGHVAAPNWVSEFSRYDAGWLPFFESENRGEIRRANWHDLNLPGRMATLAAAGLPLIQRENNNNLVAMQTLARERKLGVFFTQISQASAVLRNRALLTEIGESIWKQRFDFTFDTHADRLIEFFLKVMNGSRQRKTWSSTVCTPSESTPLTTTQPRAW